jgi:anti-sigma B factor antagonist
MEIKTQNQAEVSIVKLSGELDASNAVVVDHELVRLTSKNPKQIWIDGTDISYISSAGLGVFLSHLNNFKQKDILLLFFGLNAKIRNVFTILGLEELVLIVPDMETALEQYS